MTNPDLKISGVRRLGEALGVSKTFAAELAKQPWFPVKAADGTWSTQEVRAAYAAHKGGALSVADQARTAIAAAEQADPEAHGYSPEVVGLDEWKLRKVLETAKDPEVIASTTMQLVARSIGTSGLSVKSVIAMKAALEELRKGAAGYLEIGKAKGDLIEREIARATMAALCKRFVLALDRIGVRIASQVELWLADEKLRVLSSDERGRVVRDWVDQQTKYARIEESGEGLQEIDRMIAAEVSMRRKA